MGQKNLKKYRRAIRGEFKNLYNQGFDDCLAAIKKLGFFGRLKWVISGKVKRIERNTRSA